MDKTFCNMCGWALRNKNPICLNEKCVSYKRNPFQDYEPPRAAPKYEKEFRREIAVLPKNSRIPETDLKDEIDKRIEELLEKIVEDRTFWPEEKLVIYEEEIPWCPEEDPKNITFTFNKEDSR
jgi:hypothetical protein